MNRNNYLRHNIVDVGTVYDKYLNDKFCRSNKSGFRHVVSNVCTCRYMYAEPYKNLTKSHEYFTNKARGMVKDIKTYVNNSSTSSV